MNVGFVLSEKNDSVRNGSSPSPYLALSVMSGLFQGLPQENGCAVATAPASTPAMGLLQLPPSGWGRGFAVRVGGAESKVRKRAPWIIKCQINLFNVHEKWADCRGMGRVGGDQGHISDKHTKAQRPEREDGWEGRGQAEGPILSAHLFCISQLCCFQKHEHAKPRAAANTGYRFSHFEPGHSSRFIFI